jgi:hypothetical protein
VNSIVYCTHNAIAPEVWRVCWEQLKRAAGVHELVVCSHLPVPGCTNIVQRGPPGQATYYRQLLACLRRATQDTVYVAEHDMMYPPGYFDSQAPAGVLRYNENVVLLSRTGYSDREHTHAVFSQLSCRRVDLANILERRIAELESGRVARYDWIEPNELPIVNYRSPAVVLDVRHGQNWTGSRDTKAARQNDPYWGDSRPIVAAMGIAAVRNPCTPAYVLYTVAIGDGDEVAPPPPLEESWRALALVASRTRAVDGWESIDISQMVDWCNDSRRASRVPKMMPHLFFRADWSVYVDARVSVTPVFTEALACLDQTQDVAMFPHRTRDCVFAECRRLIAGDELRNDEKDAMLQQVMAYEAGGLPHRSGPQSRERTARGHGGVPGCGDGRGDPRTGRGPHPCDGDGRGQSGPLHAALGAT